MVVANTRVIKFVFINVIKLDTFHALVEVSKNCIKGLKQLIASDSGNDIDLTTLKGLFTVTEKVDLLASWEINSSDITRL